MARYVKPTLQTKFHIDFGWWKKKGQNLRRHLLEHACPECKAVFEAETESKPVDWIDPETGQVFAVDPLWYAIHTHCSQDPSFLDENLALTAAVFRLFLANNNTPLTPVEMHQQLHKKDARTILRTIGGHNIYKGIRPVTIPVSH